MFGNLFSNTGESISSIIEVLYSDKQGGYNFDFRKSEMCPKSHFSHNFFLYNTPRLCVK